MSAETATTLAALYRDTLAAVLEAIDIPYAATVGWDEKRQAVLDERLTHAVIALRDVLDTDPTEMIGNTSLIAFRAASFRARLAEHPAVGYVTHAEAHEALAHGASWTEAVAEPRNGVICGPGCCSPVLGMHLSCPRPHAGATVGRGHA